MKSAVGKAQGLGGIAVAITTFGRREGFADSFLEVLLEPAPACLYATWIRSRSGDTIMNRVHASRQVPRVRILPRERIRMRLSIGSAIPAILELDRAVSKYTFIVQLK